jgi:hypothetical protein
MIEQRPTPETKPDPRVIGDQPAKGKYSIPLAELEASAHVPFAELVTEQPEAPGEAPLSPTEVDRQTLLRIATGP